MDRRTLYVLVAALALLAGASLFVGQQNSSGPQQAPALPGLSPVLEQINAITITTAGGNIVARLSNTNGTWIALGSGYKANAILINSTLRQLAESKIIEAKTTNAERYARLGVQDIALKDARGFELDLSAVATSGQNLPAFSAAIILGDKTSTGQFARIKGEAQSWLIDTSLEIPGDNVDWLNRELLDIAAAELVAITIIHPDETRVELIKPNADIPEFQLIQSTVARPAAANPNKIAGILSGLRFESVQPVIAGNKPPTEVTIGKFLTREGMLITSNTWSNNEGQFFSLDITGPAGLSDDGEAQKLQEKLSGWVYTLPTYKAEQFLTTTSDLLE